MGHIALQYEMQFLPQKAVNGQAVADFLAEHPVPRMTKLYEDLPDEVALPTELHNLSCILIN